ncbi:hypothetical protein KR018_012170 [Drosophila ironensis]|nr:hypothetical protein KR018_012170 [Drosophila ironensis]
MYQLYHIHYIFCRIVRRVITGEGPQLFSIWQFCPETRWRWVLRCIKCCSLCRAEWFPLIFWSVLFLCCGGIYMAAVDLHEVLRCPFQKLRTWRSRKYCYFGHAVLRPARIFGATLALLTRITLLYGILLISPRCMGPWIVLNGLILSCEWLMWGYDLILGRQQLCLTSLVTMLLPVLNWDMVRCVKRVFEEALRQHADHSLRIFNRGGS